MRASPAPDGDRAVLEDATGRRGRWMRRLGRASALLVFGWLVVLLLGGLGLTPVADLRFADVLRPSKGPEPLAAAPKPVRPPPEDLRPARPVATTTTAPAATRALIPRSSGAQPIRIARPVASRARRSPRRTPKPTIVPPARVEPAPLPTTTAPPSPAPPGRSAVAPGHSGAPPSAPPPPVSSGRSSEAPGHSGGPPPGQPETTPGPPTTTPGRSASAPGQVAKTETPTTTTVVPTTTVTPPAPGSRQPDTP
jgi:hypothetical protein